MSDQLKGIRVIELAGIGPVPYAGQLLAEMGAEVIVINRPGVSVPTIDSRGKKSIVVDIKKPEGVSIVLELCKTASVIIEGLRPGVTERLGLGPKVCHDINPKIIYGRMTGWGQTGPWANMAGHDINYISITGALNAIGVDGQVPSPPLNLIGDYGGGTMFLIMGILASLLKAEKTGIGEIVDAAIIDGTTSMMGIVHSLHSLGQWSNKRQSNLLDGSMPFYRCYETKDHKYMAVGCLEPKFFSIMLNCLNIDKVSFGSQHDKGLWAKQNKTLEDLFFMKTRDEWSIIFNDTDACVTPVLSYTEAASHPQNVNRSNLIDIDGVIQTGPAPRFSNSDANIDFSIPKSGADTRSILKEIGYNESLIDELTSQLIVYPNE